MPGASLVKNRIQLGSGTTFLPGPKEPSVAEHISHVLTNGYVILPSIYTPSEVSLALSELERLETEAAGPASQGGRNPFEGFKTNRVYALADKSRAFDVFPIHPTALAILDYFLQPNYLMTSYHTVTIKPGQLEQEIHTDDGLIPLERPRPLLGIVWILPPSALFGVALLCDC